MKTSRLAFLAAFAFLWSTSTNVITQKPDNPSASNKPAALYLNGADTGKHVSSKVGQEIVITLQTIGPGQYDAPRISSSSVRFEGSSFPPDQNPGGPKQIYRFVSAAAGEVSIEIPHSHHKNPFQITVQVSQNLPSTN